MLDAVRLAVGTLTVLPVRPPTKVDRATWASAITLAPFVGLLVGSTSWLAGWASLEASGSTFMAAVTVVAAVAALTRGLHLDGLADVADGLGSRRPPDQARGIMRQSDIGPFGVISVLMVLLGQVASLAVTFAAAGTASAALVVIGSCLVSRTALMLTCRRGVPHAADGLGVHVVGSLSGRRALVTTAVVAIAVIGTGAILSSRWAVVVAVSTTLSLVIAELWWRHCARRLGAVTGDVLGSVEQASWTAFLVSAAMLA